MIRCLYVADENGVCTNCARRPDDGECGRTGEPLILPMSARLNKCAKKFAFMVGFIPIVKAKVGKLVGFFKRSGKSREMDKQNG